MTGISTLSPDVTTMDETIATEAGPSTAGAPLSFTELNRRLSAIPEYDDKPANNRRIANVGLLVSLIAYAATLAVAKLPIDAWLQVGIMLFLLVIELCGVAVNVWYTRGEYTSLLKPFEDFAKQLDHDYRYHFAIRSWLVSQPMDLLEKHAAMSKFRRDRFTQKLPFIAGSVSTLGVVPVVVAVYFQGRQILDGHPVTWIEWLFGFALIFFYYVTWTSTLTKSRLEAMDMYLQGALEEAKAKEAAREERRNAP